VTRLPRRSRVFFRQQSLQTASGVRDLTGARVSVPGVKQPWVKMTPDLHLVPRNYTTTPHNFTYMFIATFVWCCICSLVTLFDQFSSYLVLLLLTVLPYPPVYTSLRSRLQFAIHSKRLPLCVEENSITRNIHLFVYQLADRTLEGVRKARKSMLEYSVYGPKEVMGKKIGTYKLVNHAYVLKSL